MRIRDRYRNLGQKKVFTIFGHLYGTDDDSSQ